MSTFKLSYLLPFLLLQLLGSHAYTQQGAISVNLSTVDVGGLNKKAMFDYQVNATGQAAGSISLKGTLKYRNAPHGLSYTLTVPLRPGINNMAEHIERARFEYSSSSVKELFELFDKLPEGTFQYCVQVTGLGGEALQELVEDCVFGRNEDLFLINLVDPEDKAELYELNPMLSWVANHPIASALSYKIKVVEMKKGQNTVNAVKRNNPVYEEQGLMQMSINYPIYAKPLQVGSTYAWTVDAYYRDLLLGGAEPWQFTIVEDSLLKGIAKDPAFIDIAKESGAINLYAPGLIKLKYTLKDLRSDSLQLQLFNKDQKEVKLPKDMQKLDAVNGDNRYVIDLKEGIRLKHLNAYTLLITNSSGQQYRLVFKYANPDLIK